MSKLSMASLDDTCHRSAHGQIGQRGLCWTTPTQWPAWPAWPAWTHTHTLPPSLTHASRVISVGRVLHLGVAHPATPLTLRAIRRDGHEVAHLRVPDHVVDAVQDVGRPGVVPAHR